MRGTQAGLLVNKTRSKSKSKKKKQCSAACQQEGREQDLVHHAELVMVNMLASLTLLLLVGVRRNYAEVYSSVSDMQVMVFTKEEVTVPMQAVFQLERNMVEILLDYASNLQAKLARIRK